MLSNTIARFEPNVAESTAQRPPLPMTVSLDGISAASRNRVEQAILKIVQRAREYDLLSAEHTKKQRTYDVNERILGKLLESQGAKGFEATEMRQRQAALDDELQGLETRLAGLTKVLGWPS